MTHRATTPANRSMANPAQVAQQHADGIAREQERDRVKTVRKRRRLRRGATITTHITDETAAALTRIAFPDANPR